MIIKENQKEFAACPEFNGRAVCVDVTPLREQDSKFGKRNVFKLVFEVDTMMPPDEKSGDIRRFCVWSTNFTPSLNDKSNFRKFLRQWFGRDITEAEQLAFDTDSLIGKPAWIVVDHTVRDGVTFANIAICLPHKPATGQPLVVSGAYVRKQDREAAKAAGTTAPAGVNSMKNAFDVEEKRRAEAEKAAMFADL